MTKLPSERRAASGVVEGIDERQPVGEAVGEADREQGPRALLVAVSAARAIFGQHGVDVRVLDHHGEIERGHVGHAALGMPGVEIGAEEDVMLVGRLRRDKGAEQVGVNPGRAALAGGRTEIIDQHAH